MRAAFFMIALVVAVIAAMIARSRHRAQGSVWMDRFAVEPGELSSTGRNPYFVLEPGYVLELADGDNRLVITVLDETETIDGVETRVVEERESEDGQLVEVSRNFFAINPRNSDVFYFGEDVDVYRNGAVAGHEGAWRSGVDGARFGLMMPGEPLLGARFYEEVAPGIAMDRAEVTSLTDSLECARRPLPRCARNGRDDAARARRPRVQVLRGRDRAAPRWLAPPREVRPGLLIAPGPHPRPGPPSPDPLSTRARPPSVRRSTAPCRPPSAGRPKAARDGGCGRAAGTTGTPSSASRPACPGP